MDGRKVGKGFYEGSLFLKDSDHLMIHLIQSKLLYLILKKPTTFTKNSVRFQPKLLTFIYITPYVYFVF